MLKDEDLNRTIRQYDGQGRKPGLLATLRKHARPLILGLSVLTAGVGTGLAVKKGAEKIESVRFERIVDRAAQAESLSKMPKNYTNKFQALDDVIVLRKAWQMINNQAFIDKYAHDFVEAKQKYAHLSEKEQHDCDLLERAFGLVKTEMKQLPSEQYSTSRENALSALKKRFDEQFKCAQDGHGLLKGITPNAYGQIKCGGYKYTLDGMFEVAILPGIYQYETRAEREQFLQGIRQQVVKDNPAEHIQTPRTGGRGL